MIVVDIETSGNFEPYKNGIWQVGAIDFYHPSNIFLQDSHIDDEDAIEEGALIVTGKTKEELRDPRKQSQKDLLHNFFTWAEKIEKKTLVAQNAVFDYGFLFLKAKKYNVEFPFSHRTFDLHTFAALRYYQINGEFFLEKGSSKMNLPKILDFCGIPDNRIQMKDNKMSRKGTPHNALEDAKLESEAFSRLVYGKGLFPEYSQFTIPEYLKK